MLQWTRGRQLASFGSIASYRYDASGIRLEKTVGNTLHRYYTEYFARSKRMPKLKKVLKDIDKPKSETTKGDIILRQMAKAKGIIL